MKKLKFQQAFERLETLAEQMEDGTISLEDSLKLYKEAVELSVFCNESLNQMEAQVSILQKTAAGTFQKRGFHQEQEGANEF